MKITKLVILFNKEKIILGLLVALILIQSSTYVAPEISTFFRIFSIAIIINILLSLVASYLLYDRSDLYRPEKLFKDLSFRDADKVIFLHASFDPISRVLDKMIDPDHLKIYNLYGNRHEDEKSVNVSNRIFPPHPKQVNIDPTQIPDESNSVDYILAITSAHEILTQERRTHFFQEANRILKNDGTLILCEQMQNWINLIFFNIGAFHFVKLDSWQHSIREAGLKIVKKERLTIWGTMLYIQKSK